MKSLFTRLTAFFLLSAPLAAAVPSRITYQGRLIKSGVTAAGDNTFQACFIVAGTPFCAAPQLVTLPISGDFTLQIDVPPTVDLLNNDVRLELRVNNQPLSPTDQLNAVPYALVAATATVSLEAQSLSAPLPSSQVQLTGTGALLDSWQAAGAPTMIDAAKITGGWTKAPTGEMTYAGGNVGVGAALPQSKLHVEGRIRDVSGFVSPQGSIVMYAGATPPAGWLLCDGTAVSRATYADLFAAIGTAWGAGNGSTTFNLPDLRGRAPIGAGQGSGLTNRPLGQSLGEETHTLTSSEMPAHSHGLTDPGHSHSTPMGGVPGGGFAQMANGHGGWHASTVNTTGITIQSAGGDQPHNNMPPSAAVNFIIKF